MTTSAIQPRVFTRYQAFIIAMLAILQFTVVLDFMVLSPLGVLLLDKLQINTSQFGLVVSAYAFSAGASGLLAAGFADRFDRKKMLLFFYVGFITGTLLCATAPNYHFLLIARIVTGLFGGVISSISFAIITDLFKMEVRGRVMGFVQMAFAVSQVMGIPVGLLLANHFGWHAPFWMIAGFGALVGILIAVYMRPVNAHLAVKSDLNPLVHLLKTLSQPNYLLAFGATTLMSTGGFMLMPFASTFSTHNLGITMDQLTLLYGITGVFSMIFGPLTGKLSDRIGKFQVFCLGSIVTIITIAIYTNLGLTPFAWVVAINVFMFLGVSSRMIGGQALMTAVPEMRDRGAFMSINSSVQQISGGIGSAVAGILVVQTSSGALQHYDRLGYVAIAATLITISFMYFVNKMVSAQPQKAPAKIVEVPAEV
ncbi:MFS transporter [Chitinophaga agrisoli]|uniref:MFS transporter n=1 Tax=Chitinophaga agrisoli TaxID=2607653 RepID=A0A5B2W3K6_9BACT|nr:MFS transporter [Chitinophaga agrisoli]KAA2245428.1 MFS transporter [Chitinophaga agrisoli]